MLSHQTLIARTTLQELHSAVQCRYFKRTLELDGTRASHSHTFLPQHHNRFKMQSCSCLLGSHSIVICYNKQLAQSSREQNPSSSSQVKPSCSAQISSRDKRSHSLKVGSLGSLKGREPLPAVSGYEADKAKHLQSRTRSQL